MKSGRIIKIGKKITGFMCFRSEPYPYGNGECVPIFGQMEQLPEKPKIVEQATEKIRHKKE